MLLGIFALTFVNFNYSVPITHKNISLKPHLYNITSNQVVTITILWAQQNRGLNHTLFSVLWNWTYSPQNHRLSCGSYFLIL
jgi:hypothetical protein